VQFQVIIIPIIIPGPLETITNYYVWLESGCDLFYVIACSIFYVMLTQQLPWRNIDDAIMTMNSLLDFISVSASRDRKTIASLLLSYVYIQ
jgi:hypothetical protein